MSENQDRGVRDYSRYDSMSTEQLQEILRLDAHRDGGVEMDTDELFYIMEVLADRRRNDSDHTGKTAQQAYQTFLEEYMPCVEEEAPAKREGLPVWLCRVTAVAAVLAVFVLATVSVNAFGYDLWGKVAKWSADFFHFEDETQETEITAPDVQDQMEYTSLQDALNRFGISQKLEPDWLPDGYVLKDVSVVDSRWELSISAQYVHNNTELIISIRQSMKGTPEQIEKNENLVEVHDRNGIAYYIFSNIDQMQAVWVVEDIECIITGQLTIDEVKQIINSI